MQLKLSKFETKLILQRKKRARSSYRVMDRFLVREAKVARTEGPPPPAAREALRPAVQSAAQPAAHPGSESGVRNWDGTNLYTIRNDELTYVDHFSIM